MLYAYADNKNFYGDFDDTSACLSFITIEIILSGDYYHLFRWRTLLPGLPWILEGIFTIYSSILLIVAKYVSLPPFIHQQVKEIHQYQQASRTSRWLHMLLRPQEIWGEKIYIHFFWGERNLFLGKQKPFISNYRHYKWNFDIAAAQTNSFGKQ